jgi:hypothetical protein
MFVTGYQSLICLKNHCSSLNNLNAISIFYCASARLSIGTVLFCYSMSLLLE